MTPYGPRAPLARGSRDLGLVLRVVEERRRTMAHESCPASAAAKLRPSDSDRSDRAKHLMPVAPESGPRAVGPRSRADVRAACGGAALAAAIAAAGSTHVAVSVAWGVDEKMVRLVIAGRCAFSYEKVVALPREVGLALLTGALHALEASEDTQPLSRRPLEHIALKRTALQGRSSELLWLATADGSGVDREEARPMLRTANEERRALDAWSAVLSRIVAEECDGAAFGGHRP